MLLTIVGLNSPPMTQLVLFPFSRQPWFIVLESFFCVLFFIVLFEKCDGFFSWNMSFSVNDKHRLLISERWCPFWQRISLVGRISKTGRKWRECFSDGQTKETDKNTLLNPDSLASYANEIYSPCNVRWGGFDRDSQVLRRIKSVNACHWTFTGHDFFIASRAQE